MEIIIIITLALVSGILTIGMINMHEEVQIQKGRATEWKNRYLEEVEKAATEYSKLEKEVILKDKKIEKILLEVEQYKAKYNETLKQNKELLLKEEQALKAEESIPVVEKEEKPKTKVTATRKPRKKKGENE